MRAVLIPATVPFPQGPPRSSGVHLSGLIRGMAVEYGFLDPKWVEDLKLVEVSGDGKAWWAALDEDSQVRMGIGMAWEQWYLPQISGVIHQPGEMHVEGIYMTHDGESLDVILVERKQRHTLAIHEVKTTSKSINTVGDLNVPNPKNWLWLTQTKGYCKGRETCLAFLHILYLYGDYSRPFRPKLHLWRIEFTQDEIDETWALVTGWRDSHVG